MNRYHAHPIDEWAELTFREVAFDALVAAFLIVPGFICGMALLVAYAG